MGWGSSLACHEFFVGWGEYPSKDACCVFAREGVSCDKPLCIKPEYEEKLLNYSHPRATDDIRHGMHDVPTVVNNMATIIRSRNDAWCLALSICASNESFVSSPYSMFVALILHHGTSTLVVLARYRLVYSCWTDQ